MLYQQAAGTRLIEVKVRSPERLQLRPCDVVCVIDTSGSMQLPAMVKTAEGEASDGDGLDRLDLVKHAVRVVTRTLSPADRLAVVSYNDDVAVNLGLTQMNSVRTRVDHLASKLARSFATIFGASAAPYPLPMPPPSFAPPGGGTALTEPERGVGVPMVEGAPPPTIERNAYVPSHGCCILLQGGSGGCRRRRGIAAG